MVITKHDEEVMKNLYNSGNVNMTTIARAYGVDISTVRYHVNPICKMSKQGRVIRDIVNKTSDKDIINRVTNYLKSIKE